MAIQSPLLDDVSVDGARGILINFTAGPDMKLREIDQAASLIQEAAHDDAEIIFGLVTDPDMQEVVKVTVIATGFDAAPEVDAVRQVATGGRLAPEATVESLTRQALGGPARAFGAAEAPVPAPRRSLRSTPRKNAVPGRPSVPAAPRAFGASALHDEAVLDIPAYLRRGTSVAD